MSGMSAVRAARSRPKILAELAARFAMMLPWLRRSCAGLFFGISNISAATIPCRSPKVRLKVVDVVDKDAFGVCFVAQMSLNCRGAEPCRDDSRPIE